MAFKQASQVRDMTGALYLVRDSVRPSQVGLVSNRTQAQRYVGQRKMLSITDEGSFRAVVGLGVGRINPYSNIYKKK